jgi:hypothetical protein
MSDEALRLIEQGPQRGHRVVVTFLRLSRNKRCD